jgi:multisubunit Na+/H+ antiporter MnhB subunit
MTKLNASSTPPSRFVVVGAWVGGFAAAGGLVAMILIAIDKVSGGHGLDTYRTKWMVEDNWIGFLVFVVVTIVVVLAAAIIGWFQRRREQREIQQLETKYSAGHHG